MNYERALDPMGLHARPASLIFLEARKYTCTIEAQWIIDFDKSSEKTKKKGVSFGGKSLLSPGFFIEFII